MTWARVRQALCGLTGHDTMLRYEDERLSLRCVSCGHETPGWELNEVPPTVTQPAVAKRSCAPFADWPDSPKRDRALARWRAA